MMDHHVVRCSSVAFHVYRHVRRFISEAILLGRKVIFGSKLDDFTPSEVRSSGQVSVRSTSTPIDICIYSDRPYHT